MEHLNQEAVTSNLVSTLPKGSVSDNLDLFIALAKQKEGDVMSSSPRWLLDELLQNTPHKHSYRHADVVFFRTPQMTIVSLPSGNEIYSGNTVAMDLMSISCNIGDEEDLIMYAECVDNMLKEVKKQEAEQAQLSTI